MMRVGVFPEYNSEKFMQRKLDTISAARPAEGKEW
jgi:hypothetical protein